MASVGKRVIVNNGIQYVYDSTRQKFLSATRVIVEAGVRFHQVTNTVLRTSDGSPMSVAPYYLLRNATIVGLSGQSEVGHTWILSVLKNDNPSAISFVSLVNQSFVQNLGLNIDVDLGDRLVLKAVGTNIPFPKGILEIAWRL